MADDELSPQDIQDLQQIKGMLPANDARGAKIDALLQSQPGTSAAVPKVPKPIVPQGTQPPSAMDKFMDMIPQGAIDALRPFSTPEAVPTLGREVVATGKAIGNVASFDQHPNMPMEIANSLSAGMLKPAMALGQQATQAAKWYAGNAPDKVGQVLENAPEGIGTGAGTVIQGALLGKGANIAGAEGNPGALYRKYLDPVADTKAQLPEMTPKIKTALVNKVAINNPEVAGRMQSGETTLGDLDTIRQVANSSSQAMFKQTGGMPTEMNRGFQNAAGAIRGVLYPAIEQAHGLEPGSLTPIKLLQGDLMSTAKPPSFGYNPVTWPAKAATRFGLMPAERAFTTLRTKAIAAGMPEPTGGTP